MYLRVVRYVDHDKVFLLGMTTCSASDHLRVKKSRLRGSGHDDCVHARLIKAFGQNCAVRHYPDIALREPNKSCSSILTGHIAPNCGRAYAGSLERLANILSMRNIHTEYDCTAPIRILLVRIYKEAISVAGIHGLC